MVLEKTLGSPLNCKEINQSILKEINPEYSLERLMLKLKLQYFGNLVRRANSLGKILVLGKIEGRDYEGQGSLAYCSPWGHKELDTIERLNNKQKSQVKEFSTFLCMARVWVH